jgi:hypothetical protein
MKLDTPLEVVPRVVLLSSWVVWLILPLGQTKEAAFACLPLYVVVSDSNPRMVLYLTQVLLVVIKSMIMRVRLRERWMKSRPA